MMTRPAVEFGHCQRRGVLITRPEPGGSETVKRVAAAGFDPVLAPLLRITTLPMRPPGAVDAVLVTSGNALAPLPAILYHLPLLAVGDATAARARQSGFTKVCSADGDAAALADLAARLLPVRASLLLAAGKGQGGALSSTLRGQGFRVHRRVVYAARPLRALPVAARDALAEGRLRAAMFLSADTARAFVRVLPVGSYKGLAEVNALVIGQPAADVLMHLPWRSVRVSAKPTLASLMALI